MTDTLFRLSASTRLRADDLVAKSNASLIADDFFDAVTLGPLVGGMAIGVAFVGAARGRAALSGALPIALSMAGGALGVGQLAGSLSTALSLDGAMGGSGRLAGDAAIGLALAGALEGRGMLAGDLSFGVDLAGELAGLGRLEGALPFGLGFAGDLSALGRLAGSVPIAVAFAGIIRDARQAGLLRIRIGVSEATEIRSTASPVTTIRASATPLATIVARTEAPVDVGDIAQIIGEFKVAGTLTDPTTVKLVVRPPEADRFELVYGTDAALAKLETGRFQARVPITEVGTWRYQWVSTGAAAGAESGRFEADNPAL